MRLQLALNVKDLDAAIDFYSKMFDTPVHKRRPGYANFAIEEPPLKLVLFEAPDAVQKVNHLGVEVLEDGDVDRVAARFEQLGIEHRLDPETTCCHATQDKVWAIGPEAALWEWYQITQDELPELPKPVQSLSSCC